MSEPTPDLSLAKCQRKTRNLMKRIERAAERGDYAEVDRLLQFYIRSWAALMLSLAEEQAKAPGATAGVDGVVIRTEADGLRMIAQLQQQPADMAQPVRRVYIDKGNGQMRPLGISSQADKICQRNVKRVVEPLAERVADPHSFGFRPGRSAHDAIRVIEQGLMDPTLRYVLDADIQGFFDNISHEVLLREFPIPGLRRLVRAWLEAGYIENGVWYPAAGKGTPQGAVISPLLANLALDGLEALLKAKVPGCVFVRYADDFCVISRSEAELYILKEVVEEFLAARGLVLAQDKTRCVTVEEGFDFLGVRIQRIAGTVELRASEKSHQRLWSRVNALLQDAQPNSQKAVLKQVHRCLDGWLAYFGGYLDTDQTRAIEQQLHKLLVDKRTQSRGHGQICAPRGSSQATGTGRVAGTGQGRHDVHHHDGQTMGQSTRGGHGRMDGSTG